jgi:EAL domain-containing protein (putative c-di-GMP-specific phosphodiesterase class I)
VVNRFKARRADVPPGADNPINYAVTQRDKDTPDMVRDAVIHKQMLLAYQPVMRASNPAKVAFYEGLIRVLDATDRVIPASDFMPQVEGTELGREIDVQALRMGLQALRANPGLRLSINMSARSIGYTDWNKTLRRHLKQDDTLGERLILEITENSAMLVPELVVNFMDELQPHGVCFALDNYGAGNTAIRYFKDFFFDILKIDGQFVRGIAQNPDNRAITAALLSVAGHFDMLTVAENVENAEDAALLTQMGVDCLQGYFFSAPTVQPAWLRQNQPSEQARSG